MTNKKTPTTPEETLEMAIHNIVIDRATATSLISNLIPLLNKDPSRTKEFGLAAAKYIEALQRSSEQLIRVAECFRKISTEEEINDDLKEDILDQLQEEDI